MQKPNGLWPIPEKAQRQIANNVIKACKDIEKLNGPGYIFISGMSGFIAHYNIEGFKGYYSAQGQLAKAIRENARQNQYTNFSIGETNAEYYHSKRDIYNAILERV